MHLQFPNQFLSRLLSLGLMPFGLFRDRSFSFSAISLLCSKYIASHSSDRLLVCEIYLTQLLPFVSLKTVQQDYLYWRTGVHSEDFLTGKIRGMQLHSIPSTDF
jgi:hypothetical protein